ncbi:unnamed protein product [Caenorhabditis brenneri]
MAYIDGVVQTIGQPMPEKRFQDSYLSLPEIREHKDFKSIVQALLEIEDAQNLKRLRTIKGGSFGDVSVVQSPVNRKHHFALKTMQKMSVDEKFPLGFLQEVLMLSSLKHKYVVRFVKCLKSKNHENYYNFHLLFELCTQDLENIIFSTDIPLPLIHLKTISQQILKGLQFVHQASIMHRDVKPGNILVSPNGVVKLADFGMSCYYGEKVNGPLQTNVCTLGYRAPELLLGSKKYEEKVDIWSLGVIVGEMYLRGFLIFGKDGKESLASIANLCGGIREANWPGCRQLPRWRLYEHNIAFVQEKSLRKRLQDSATRYGKKKVRADELAGKMAAKVFYDEQGVDFLEKILKLDPSNRPTATDALKHSWFKTDPRPGKDVLELLDDFAKREVTRL